MNGTRAITAWSSKIYNVGFNKQVVGRVKTPTLAMIVNRDKEIDLFIPEKYFQIKATFRINSGEYVGSYIDQILIILHLIRKQKELEKPIEFSVKKCSKNNQ